MTEYSVPQKSVRLNSTLIIKMLICIQGFILFLGTYAFTFDINL